MPMVKLDDSRIRWIVRCKQRGLKNQDIADVIRITPRRVQQVYSAHEKDGQMPALRKPGRPEKPITRHEIRLVRQAHKRFRTNALYLEKAIFRLYDTHINHNRIHRIMIDEGLSVEQPRKKMRRKWIRYEKEYPRLAVAYRLARNTRPVLGGNEADCL